MPGRGRVRVVSRQEGNYQGVEFQPPVFVSSLIFGFAVCVHPGRASALVPSWLEGPEPGLRLPCPVQ